MACYRTNQNHPSISPLTPTRFFCPRPVRESNQHSLDPSTLPFPDAHDHILDLSKPTPCCAYHNVFPVFDEIRREGLYGLIGIA